MSEYHGPGTQEITWSEIPRAEQTLCGEVHPSLKGRSEDRQLNTGSQRKQPGEEELNILNPKVHMSQLPGACGTFLPASRPTSPASPSYFAIFIPLPLLM